MSRKGGLIMELLIGKVSCAPVYLEGICTYKITASNCEYIVVSRDYQAALDNIFIDVGQMVELIGSVCEGTIHIKKSKIILREGDK